MSELKYCIDELRGSVSTSLGEINKNLEEAKKYINSANNANTTRVDKSGLISAKNNVDAAKGLTEECKAWIMEKIAAFENLEYQNNELVYLFGEGFDFNSMTREEFDEWVKALYEKTGKTGNENSFFGNSVKYNIENSNKHKDWLPSSVLVPEDAQQNEKQVVIWIGDKGNMTNEWFEQKYMMNSINNGSLKNPDVINAFIHGESFSAKQIDDFINALASEYKINKDNIVLAGYGKGGNTALRLATEDPERYNKVAIMDSYVAPEGWGYNLQTLKESGVDVIGIANSNQNSGMNSLGDYFSVTNADGNNYNSLRENLVNNDADGDGVSDFFKWALDGKENVTLEKLENEANSIFITESNLHDAENIENVELEENLDEVELEENTEDKNAAVEKVELNQNAEKNVNKDGLVNLWTDEYTIVDENHIIIGDKNFSRKLYASAGKAIGPTGMLETWYDLDMYQAVEEMRKKRI